MLADNKKQTRHIQSVSALIQLVQGDKNIHPVFKQACIETLKEYAYGKSNDQVSS